MTAMAEQPTASTTPANLDAEEYVLSAMMMSSVAIDRVQTELDPADFYRESHAKIYRAALSLHQLGEPVDGITVADRLQEQGQLADVGGRDRINELVGHAPATANVLHHARIIIREARRRHAGNVADEINRRVLQGDDPAELEQRIRDLAGELADRRPVVAPPRIASLDDFVNAHEERAEAAVGDSTNTLLPAGGLLIIGGEGGASKTTLTLDAVAHLASGTPWLGYPVQRPIRILILENEGPRPQFRDKLREKLDAWQGKPWRGNVHVWEEPWAQFSFARDTDRDALRATTLEHRIDLVVGDPLDTLGVIGAGTPEDTRTFITWLRQCGLHNPDQPLAFWLLHHFNKQGRGSIIQQLSGAWGGHPDAILGVELGDNHTTKLTWGKLRHATPPPQRTIILAWNVDTRGFTALQPDDPAALEAKQATARDWILDHVETTPGLTRTIVETAFADKHGRGGRSLARHTIDAALAAQELQYGPGVSARGKYLYPASTLNRPFAEQLFDSEGQTANTNLSAKPNGGSETQNPAKRHGHSIGHSPNTETANSGEYDAPLPDAVHSPFADPPKGGGVGEMASTADHPDADLDALFGAPEVATDEKKGAP